jgi:hypothetical protein
MKMLPGGDTIHLFINLIFIFFQMQTTESTRCQHEPPDMKLALRHGTPPPPPPRPAPSVNNEVHQRVRMASDLVPLNLVVTLWVALRVAHQVICLLSTHAPLASSIPFPLAQPTPSPLAHARAHNPEAKWWAPSLLLTLEKNCVSNYDFDIMIRYLDDLICFIGAQLGRGAWGWCWGGCPAIFAGNFWSHRGKSNLIDDFDLVYQGMHLYHRWGVICEWMEEINVIRVLNSYFYFGLRWIKWKL